MKRIFNAHLQIDLHILGPHHFPVNHLINRPDPGPLLELLNEIGIHPHPGRSIHADGENGEKKEGQTDEQFIYKTRKKALGPFKRDILNLPGDVKDRIIKSVESKFDFLFGKLKIADTLRSVHKYAPLKPPKMVLKDEHPGAHLDGEGDD